MNDTPSGADGMSRPKGRLAGKRLKLAFFIVVIVVVGAFFWAESARRAALQELEQTSAQFEEFKKSTEDSSQETATRVRENVAKLINVPTDPPPTVATISDVEKLRASNEFFNAAQNGDYLILTGNRAILYNLDQNIILDVAPFRVSSPSPSLSGSASPTARPAVVSPSPSVEP